MNELIRTVERVTAYAAQELIRVAVAAMEAEALTASVAIVDETGRPVTVHTMDGAAPQSAMVAQKKAFTAVAFGKPSDEFMERARSFGPDGAAMMTSAIPDIMLLGGGVPIRHRDVVVGAIGVSGGTGDQDKAVAQHAIAAVFGSTPSS